MWPSKIESLPNIYAVSLTTQEFTEKEYEEAKKNDDKGTQIVDLLISFADNLVIVEVKRSGENCLGQLKTQISKVPGNESCQIKFRSVSWAKIISTLELCIKRREAGGNPIPRITSDYFIFLSSEFPSWVSAKLLSRIKVITEDNIVQIEKRIDKIKNLLGYELNSVGGRFSVPIDWAVASEININLNADKDAITVGVWPGDTRSQGWSLWSNNKWKEWIKDAEMKIGENAFKVETTSYVKFSHFTQGVDWIEGIEIGQDILGEDFFTAVSGRKKRSDWGLFDEAISRFIPNWKSKCKWDEKFQNSNRSYVDVSIGIAYKVIIPFSVISKMDIEENQGKDIIDFLKSVMHAMKDRIVGQN